MNTSQLFLDMDISLNFSRIDGDSLTHIRKLEFDTSDHEKWISILSEEDQRIDFLKSEFLKEVSRIK